MQSSLSRYISVSSFLLLAFALAMGCGDAAESIGKPSGFRLVQITDYDSEAGGFGRVVIEWSHLHDASTYQVQRAAPDSGRDFEFIQWSFTWLEDHGYLLDEPFLPGHTYVYRVRGFRHVAGPWSEEFEVNIPLFQPPENLTATYLEAENNVLLEWDGEKDPQHLRWRVSRTSDRSDVPDERSHPDWVRETPVPLFEDHYVLPGCSYEYEVQAIHDMFGSTEARTVVMDIPRAGGPAMLDATEGDPESITVSWEHAQGFETEVSYELYRATADPEDEESYERIPPHDIDFTQYHDRFEAVDESIQYGKWHYYRVKTLFSGDTPFSCSSYSEMSENYVAGWAGPTEPDEPPQ